MRLFAEIQISCMNDLAGPQVAILIPHFRTLQLTQLCLRSLRKYTNLARIQVIVIDNGSKDASTDYLRRLSWITLIEREPVPGESVAQAHSRALDLGMTRVVAAYVISMHTDTVVISPGWLDYLLEQIGTDQQVAGVGSWKLEFKPWYRRAAKRLESTWLAMSATCRKRLGQQGAGGSDDKARYLRSHCALYRSDLLRRLALSFDEDEVAGKVLHEKLVQQGFTMKFLDIHGLARHVRHINHATMVLNPGIAGRKTGSEAERRRVRRELERLDYRNILQDASLDDV